MNRKNDDGINLESAWKPEPCENIQNYLQEAYGKEDQAGHRHAFRGVNTRYGNLQPSFYRGDIRLDKPVETETGLLEEFIVSAWEYLTPQERHRYLLSEKRWGSKRNTGALVVARHRLVPTRCLDWSYDPLCALFFACSADSESGGNSKVEGEVWWFNKDEFDLCVAAQWPALFGKHGYVMPEIEEEFRNGIDDASWFTALEYMDLPGDRPNLQKAWITVAGRLEICHAEKIHRLGVRQKGRLVITPKLKLEAIRELEQLGTTSESLGLNRDHPADEIARQITKKFWEKYDKRPLRNCTTARKEDA